MQVLFATCYDPSQLEGMGALAGRSLACETTPGGVVKWREVDAAEAASHAKGGLPASLPYYGAF
jgi:hypothetical protein